MQLILKIFTAKLSREATRHISILPLVLWPLLNLHTSNEASVVDDSVGTVLMDGLMFQIKIADENPRFRVVIRMLSNDLPTSLSYNILMLTMICNMVVKLRSSAGKEVAMEGR